MKRTFLRRMALAVLVFLALAGVGWGAGQPPLTMLVVPARYSVLQVAFDVANRFPVVLVSYQGDASTESPLIHAWNGQEWVPVSLQSYMDVSFVRTTPSQTILVGDDKLLPPALASSAETWCPKVLNIASIDTTTLVNSLAPILNFSDYDWRWFARRYNLTLTDLNQTRREKSWYDRSGYTDEWTDILRGRRPRRRPSELGRAPESIPPVDPSPVIEAAPEETAGMGETAIAPVPAAPAEPVPEMSAPAPVISAEPPAVEAPATDDMPLPPPEAMAPAAETEMPVK